MNVQWSFRKTLSKEAYMIFVRDYKSTLYRLALGYLKEEADALEAVDEAVYLGLLKLHQLKEQEKLKPWLTSILINECRGILRRQKKLLVTEVLPEVVDDTKAVSMTLREALGKLPEDLQEVIILRYFGDYTVKDTAQELNLPQGTVATRTKKALALLKEELISLEGGMYHESI